MSLTPNEAADALRDIEETGRRSGQAFGYRISGPFAIIWGIFCIVCYGATDFWPDQANIIWPAGIVVATIASLFAGGRIRGRRNSGGWRFGVLVLIAFAFLIAVDLIMQPVGPRQQAAFAPLVVAAIYAGCGLWIGVRFVVMGAAVAALTLFGFFYIHEHFNLWMAAVGGGGLVLAGLWLRAA
jgi:hypothetical protein